MLDNKNLSEYSYRNVSEPTKSVYTVLNLEGDAIAGVKINQATISGKDFAPFVCLNEFEAYGDCLPGFWGLDCKKLCPEPCKSSCHVQLGTCNIICNGYSDPPLCSIACIKSFYGLNCTNNCPVNCVDNTCDSISGKCLACKPGFTGDYCTKACDDFMFGKKCLERCSSVCTDKKCNSTTGKCFSCMPGFLGAFCNQSCGPSLYGQDCQHNCSNLCVDSLCNSTDGSCFNCIEGKFGQFCSVSDRCNSQGLGPGIGIGIAIGVVSIVLVDIAIYFIFINRRQPPANANDPVDKTQGTQLQQYDSLKENTQYKPHYETVDRIDLNKTSVTQGSTSINSSPYENELAPYESYSP